MAQLKFLIFFLFIQFSHQVLSQEINKTEPSQNVTKETGPSKASTPSLSLLNQQSFDPQDKFHEIQMGGFSGLHYRDGVLWVLSDDRGGKAGDPRLYKFELTSSENKKKWTVKPSEMHYLGQVKGVKVLDPEALHVFEDGQVLISSEGDLNQKPRVAPMLRFWTPSKKWGQAFPIPKEAIPEKTGMQTKGILNNAGFEGFAVDSAEKKLWMMSEQPFFQSKKSEIEIFEYELRKKVWKISHKYEYTRDLPQEGSIEILRGISEALWWKENRLLVFERYLRVEATNPKSVNAELFSVHLNGRTIEKKKLLNLDKELGANWEGMTWGPDLPDGGRLLILVSDNNFEKNNPTRFLFYSFKE